MGCLETLQSCGAARTAGVQGLSDAFAQCGADAVQCAPCCAAHDTLPWQSPSSLQSQLGTHAWCWQVKPSVPGPSAKGLSAAGRHASTILGCGAQDKATPGPATALPWRGLVLLPLSLGARTPWPQDQPVWGLLGRPGCRTMPPSSTFVLSALTLVAPVALASTGLLQPMLPRAV